MELVLTAVCLGFIPAYIASLKGRDPFLWYFYGVLLFIVALVHSIYLHGNTKCPKCAEFISSEAKVCKYCRSEQTEEQSSNTLKDIPKLTNEAKDFINGK